MAETETVTRIKIKVLNGGNFDEKKVVSTTLGGLKSELNIPPRSSVSINAVTVEDNNHPIAEGDMIAAVENDKGGGKLNK